MATHSLSAVHARQVFVVLLQMGVAPEQVELSVHCTHAPVAEHAGRVASAAAHSAPLVHPAHVFVAVLQIGVVSEQLALVRHWTHLFVVVSQTGVAPEHVVLSVHWTQAPVAAHAGLVASAALHCAAVVQAPQVWLLQIGVVPEQLVLVKHCTHLFVAVSQTGVAPEHVELSVHWTQVPAVEHAGSVASLARHSAPVEHTPQRWAVEQIGVVTGQVALVRHCTHLFVAVSQTGVAPEHAELSMHCTHAPVGAHTGRVGSMVAH